jgi:hypothetical protein
LGKIIVPRTGTVEQGHRRHVGEEEVERRDYEFSIID